jgi:plasmid maintenance system antidote protein VapI
MSRTEVFGQIIVFGVLFICVYMYLANRDTLDLKCVVSTVDGNKYCVRDRDEVNKAADLLAKTTQKCKKLVEHLFETYPEKDNVLRLYERFNPNQIMETLPTSEYTAYSENKGEKLAFCLNKQKQENNNLIDEHTLMFVATHELAHIATKSIGHKTEFWQNFKFLLEEAEKIGIHKPVDYKKQNQEYCGMKIRDNPYYDA